MCIYIHIYIYIYIYVYIHIYTHFGSRPLSAGFDLSTEGLAIAILVRDFL